MNIDGMRIRMRTPEIVLWDKDYNNEEYLMKREVIIFKKMDGVYVPLQPWPQRFFVSNEFIDIDMMELRPLTITNIFKSIIINFITMNHWRFCYVLYKAGFLNCDIWEYPNNFKYFNLHPIKTLKKRAKKFEMYQNASNDNINNYLASITNEMWRKINEQRKKDKKGRGGSESEES